MNERNSLNISGEFLAIKISLERFTLSISYTKDSSKTAWLGLWFKGPFRVCCLQTFSRIFPGPFSRIVAEISTNQQTCVERTSEAAAIKPPRALPIMVCRGRKEAAPEKGTFFRLRVYKRIGFSQIEVYKRVGK